MSELTISQLIASAAKGLRAEFEQIRATNPHSGDKGTEVEGVVRTFLNKHMPGRFRASEGIAIDNKNAVSRQTDVLVYDAHSSPIYRAGEKTQIVPVDTVAAVVEVKSRLTRHELEDAYKKIASCKRLDKTPLQREVDQAPTASRLSSVATLGAVFAFSSAIELVKVAEHMIDLNKEHPSDHWPDIVVILDRGVIDYGVQFPGDSGIRGAQMPSFGRQTGSPPLYVIPIIHEDGVFSLNRFFNYLLAHLAFYPRRPGLVPMDILLQDTNNMVRTMDAYQYRTDGALGQAPEEAYGEGPRPLAVIDLALKDSPDQVLARLELVPWQDGAVIFSMGKVRLQDLLGLLMENPGRYVLPAGDGIRQLSCVLAISEADFKGWAEKITANTPLVAKVVDPLS